MTSSTLAPPHPLVAALAGIGELLKDIRDVPAWSLGPVEMKAILLEGPGLEAGLTEVLLRVLESARTAAVGIETGASSTENWWSHATRRTRHDAHRSAQLAAGLAKRDAVRVALASGEVNVEQAQVIGRALDDLPGDTEPEVAARAEAYLLDQAACFDAEGLRTLAEHLLDVVDPAAGEAQEAAALGREERLADASARLTMTDDGHGRTYGRFTMPTAQAVMLKKALRAIAAPRHQRSRGPGPAVLASPERLGRAFCEYVERYPAKKLPRAGGVNAAVVVTMSLETLGRPAGGFARHRGADLRGSGSSVGM